jgi:hypothetical protein
MSLSSEYKQSSRPHTPEISLTTQQQIALNQLHRWPPNGHQNITFLKGVVSTLKYGLGESVTNWWTLIQYTWTFWFHAVMEISWQPAELLPSNDRQIHGVGCSARTMKLNDQRIKRVTVVYIYFHFHSFIFHVSIYTYNLRMLK